MSSELCELYDDVDGGDDQSAEIMCIRKNKILQCIHSKEMKKNSVNDLYNLNMTWILLSLNHNLNLYLV